MASKRESKRNKSLSTGGIIALVVAALVLVAILVGVVLYVHSGKAGVNESAGLVTANETTLVEQKTTASEEETDATDASSDAKSTTKADASTTTVKAKINEKEVVTKADGSAAVVYKKSLTAKQLGQYFKASPEDTFKQYDSKTVTLTGTLSDKSSKMLYVELKTGTNVPCRVYLNSEEQREQFNAIENGTKIKVKGTVGIMLPSSVDPGGFQEMANGLIALEDVTLVK